MSASLARRKVLKMGPQNAKIRLAGIAGWRQVVLDKASIVGDLISAAYVRKLTSELDQSPFLRGKQVAALVVLESWLRANLRQVPQPQRAAA